jgi:cytosolic carboxypeptidase protein 2/3
MHTVKNIQKDNPQIVNVNYHHFSTGGLTIPIIHITNPNENENKATCMAIGRLHPGETQGSWMMDGFLRFICSAKAHALRDKIVFRIIPMVNVDGVVLGNFRTSIVGRDINRYFHRPELYE